MEIKIMVAKLLQEFQIVKTDKTNLELSFSLFLLSHANAFVKLVPRTLSKQLYFS